MSVVPITRRRIRAPQADGAALFAPPLAAAAQAIEQNIARRQPDDVQSCWWVLAKFTSLARRELLAAALAHTGEYADVSWVPRESRRFILSGHQPQLFHPGVWLKNFALSVLGERTGAVPINLIVDNDTIRSAAIRIPRQQGGEVEVPAVAIDAAGDEVAWEEREVLSPELFASFGQRACEVLGQAEPILASLWPLAQAAQLRHGAAARLGLLLAEARHRYEQQCGLRTLEVPLSAVCQTTSFRHFVWQLLRDLPRLVQVYNAALAEYRQVNRLRSRSHPVPDLARQDDWLEAPLWIWTSELPRRQRLFVRERAGKLQLSNLAGVEAEIEAAENFSAAATNQLAALEQQGIKLRPRALVTTMFSRLLLSDFFIHGIGGAKYDELTDAIIRRYFDCEPPVYLTATATFRLPIDRPDVTAADLAALDQRTRELRFHPERFLAGAPTECSAELARLAEQKSALLAAHELRGAPRETFLRLDALNRRMHDLLLPLQAAALARRAEMEEEWRQARLLGSREFSFVLFPQATLPSRLLDLCAPGS